MHNAPITLNLKLPYTLLSSLTKYTIEMLNFIFEIPNMLTTIVNYVTLTIKINLQRNNVQRSKRSSNITCFKFICKRHHMLQLLLFQLGYFCSNFISTVNSGYFPTPLQTLTTLGKNGCCHAILTLFSVILFILYWEVGRVKGTTT